MERQGYRYSPYRLRPDRAAAAKLWAALGAAGSPDEVPPTYMIFLRGETRGVDLFTDLDIPREKALHGGQRYEWYAPILWDDEVEVTATVEKLTEKEGRQGKIWFADVAFDYVLVRTGERALREITRLVKLS